MKASLKSKRKLLMSQFFEQIVLIFYFHFLYNNHIYCILVASEIESGK